MTAPTAAEVAELVRRLMESAEEVESFPHPSHCDHLHSAFKVMRESAAALAALQAALDSRRPDEYVMELADQWRVRADDAGLLARELLRIGRQP